jgi:hypothetical protein
LSVLKKFRKKGQQEQQVTAFPSKAPERGNTILQSGYRYDENGNSYWLTGEEMAEVARLNAEIDDDDEFWKAFRELREAKGIKPSVYNRASSFSGGSSYKSSGNWKDPSKGKSFMSEWWSGYKSWNSGKSATETKLAVMRRAIEVTLSVVDDSNKLHMKYSDDQDQPVSFTDMRSNLVVISAKPVLDRLPDGEALDIMSGFGMHEASHSKYTRSLLKPALEKPTPLRPFAIAGLMANLAEDYRIEALTSEEFPGFAGYFTAALDYMWEEGEKSSKKKHPVTGKPLGWPKTYGPDLNDKVNGAIAIVKWENDFRKKVSGKDWDAEFEWWTKWRNDYNENKVDLRQTVERALAHLRMPTEKEEAEGKSKPDERSENGKAGAAGDQMDAQEAAEKAAEAAGAALEEAIRKYIEENGTPDFCTHRDHGDGHKVSAGANEAIGKLIDDEVEFEEPKVRKNAYGKPPPVIITKPKENPYSKRYYSSESDPMASKYRAALVFRPDKEIHSTKLLKRGKVDGTQLYRWAVDDWRMFMEKGRKVDPSAYVYLLVDMSGSMGGDKLRAAQRMAKLFIQALSSMDGVTPKVFGHTGDTEQTSCDVYRIWEPGDAMSRNGLIMSLPHSNNYDGYAIEWVGNRLASESRNNEQRLLIVLSDGYPAGHNYGGISAENHVREVVNELRTKHRIRTLQIAIDTSLDSVRQGRMFDEFIPYRPGDSLDSVPKRLTQWLERVL